MVDLHALYECGSVLKMFGQSKSMTLNAVNKVPLNDPGEVDAKTEQVMREGGKQIGQNQSSFSENKSTIRKNKSDRVKTCSKAPVVVSHQPTKLLKGTSSKRTVLKSCGKIV